MHNRLFSLPQPLMRQTPARHVERPDDLPARQPATAGRPSVVRAPVTLAPDEVLLDVLYCGLGNAEIDLARRQGGQLSDLIGQEIVARVRATGSGVTRAAAGDLVGVGAIAASCGLCVHCLGQRQQYCLKGATRVRDYQQNRADAFGTRHPATHLVVTEPFLVRIPTGAALPWVAPMLGAAVATYSPMAHWRVGAGQRVGIIGMGGLGHMAVKLATARGAQVTVFTTSPDKQVDAQRFGACEAILWNDEPAFNRLANHFDLMISTVPRPYAVGDFMDMLTLNGTLVNVGSPDILPDTSGTALARGRRSLAGSLGAGQAEMQALVDTCTANAIHPEIEIIRPDEATRLLHDPMPKPARYRYVIDFAGTPLP